MTPRLTFTKLAAYAMVGAYLWLVISLAILGLLALLQGWRP